MTRVAGEGGLCVDFVSLLYLMPGSISAFISATQSVTSSSTGLGGSRNWALIVEDVHRIGYRTVLCAY